jgi:monoamine oxidase
MRPTVLLTTLLLLLLIVDCAHASVIVVGGGVAGLAAAQYLTARGHAVTVLEARPRLGGRVFTNATALGLPIEVGAQFIHGEYRVRAGACVSVRVVTGLSM